MDYSAWITNAEWTLKYRQELARALIGQKPHVLSEYKTQKKRVLQFFACKIYILKQMKKPKPCITL